MGIPQIIYIVLISAGLLFSARDHGKTKEGKNNFFKVLTGEAIVVGLLIWGGFFSG